MKKQEKALKELSKEEQVKIVGGQVQNDELDLFSTVKEMKSLSSLVDQSGDEFSALRGKTHRAGPTGWGNK